jgi:hypothetical protein
VAIQNKIYLDACCLNRPFDDQSYDRVRIETEAVVIILGWVSSGRIKLAGSEILKYEINKTPDVTRKQKVLSLLKLCSTMIAADEKIRMRAKELAAFGFSGLDAYHIASAEKGRVDCFLTTDDAILKLGKRCKDKIGMRIIDPINYVQEMILK